MTFWQRAAVWIERWLQPLAFSSGYIPMQEGALQPDLSDQLEELLAFVRKEELKWKKRGGIRTNVPRRHSERA